MLPTRPLGTPFALAVALFSARDCAAQPQAQADCAGAGAGRVSISFSDTWPTSCIPRDPVVVITGRTVSLHATSAGDFCLQVFTPYSVSGQASPLCDGAWETEVVIHRNDGSIFQTVRGPTVRIACSTADFNDDCLVTIQDVLDFLTAYFAGDTAADVNGSGAVTPQDVFDFLAAYFDAA
ncbi:MAG: GC-type dockerin domain-anchored protein [Phycisphaerales bacterium]